VELEEPKLDKEKINIIKSVIRGVFEFSELSNFARTDIAYYIKARKVKKDELIINLNDIESANAYVLLEGNVRIFYSEEEFKVYKEHRISQILKEDNEKEALLDPSFQKVILFL
jgi:hypothetical protein